ncbi:hypothetical protein C8R44DRAFT_931635 [Mycena epipterygia]|nr:hypothetical protein C8R44DRAFT_931635 [Mycena epipterygia]
MAANSLNPPTVDAEFWVKSNAIGERVEQRLLSETEVFWRDHNSRLKDHGYVLRPRYQPGWVASWKLKEHSTTGLVEDRITPPGAFLLHAVRTSDGLPVMFKGKQVGEDPELQIIQKLSSEPLASDPKSHCVRLIEILNLPDTEPTKLIVISLLFDWRHPHFKTIGEAVEFMSQNFEGLKLCGTDCKVNNIMMGSTPIRVSSVHPLETKYTSDLLHRSRYRIRTGHPVQYYWIDFDMSGEHDPSTGPLTSPNYGGTRDVPEFAFPDSSQIGCVTPLPSTAGILTQNDEAFVADMTHEDPSKRPSMDDVIRRFSEIKAGLSQWKLRSRFAKAEEHVLVNIFRSTSH